jgi:hypothetical protein
MGLTGFLAGPSPLREIIRATAREIKDARKSSRQYNTTLEVLNLEIFTTYDSTPVLPKIQ